MRVRLDEEQERERKKKRREERATGSFGRPGIIWTDRRTRAKDGEDECESNQIKPADKAEGRGRLGGEGRERGLKGLKGKGAGAGWGRDGGIYGKRSRTGCEGRRAKGEENGENGE